MGFILSQYQFIVNNAYRLCINKLLGEQILFISPTSFHYQHTGTK